jgi:hypothetical protein
MTSYITLKGASNPSPLKLAILSPNWVPTIDRPQWHEMSEAGTLISQYGPVAAAKYWDGLAKVWATPPVGYASRADVEAWASATTQGDIDLVMVDHEGASHNVRLVGAVAFPPIGPMSPYYPVQIRLQKRS